MVLVSFKEMKYSNRKRCGLSLIPPAVAALVGPPITGSILGRDYIWWKGILFASVGIVFHSVIARIYTKFL